MTVVGKILVFFNLLFSVVVGFLAVVDYSTRTRWAKGFEELQNANSVVVASRDLYKAQSDQRGEALQQVTENLAKAAVDHVPDLREKDEKGKDKKVGGGFVVDKDKVPQVGPIVVRALQGLREQNKLYDAETDRLRALVVAERNKSGNAEKASVGAIEDAKLRQKDVEDMRKLLRAETDANNKLIVENNNLRDKTVQSEIERRTAQDRANELAKQVEDMARQLERLKSSGGGGGGVARGSNPPPDDLEGLIKRTDASGLVTITIGSDSGVAKGHTLEVFRLKPLPKYLGQIRILSVTHKEAVGQATGRLTGALLVGDVVASRIQGR